MNANKKDQPGSPPPAGGGDMLPAKQQTAGQQLMVWFLVIMVGVLFGMGPALGLIVDCGAPEYADVSQAEAQRYGQVETNLSIILQGQADNADWRSHAYTIWQSRLAEEEGLLPEGDALDQLVADFLNQEARGGRTQGNLLQDYKDSNHAIRPADLRWYLQVTQGVTNLFSRRLVIPATPITAAGALQSAAFDRVNVTEVELSTAALLDQHREAAAADELALREAYDELKETWFRVPANRTITLYVSDPAVIGEKLSVSDEELQTWYEANRTQYPQWQVEKEEGEADAAEQADAEEESEPVYKKLTEVRDEVDGFVRQELAIALSKRLQQNFETELQRLLATGTADVADLSAQDLADVVAASAIPAEEDRHLTESVTLQIISDVVIAQPQSAAAAGERGLEVEIPNLGMARFSQDPFSPEVADGFVDYPRAAGEGVGLTVQLQGRVPSSYQSFEEAREEVITWVAGQAAWSDLVAAAQEIAQGASEIGDGGLATFFGDEKESKMWSPVIAERSLPVLRRLEEPPAEPAGQNGEAYVVTDLLTPALPVRLAAAESAMADTIIESLPRLRLIQGRTYERGVGSSEPAMMAASQGDGRNFRALYAGALSSYQSRQYREELQRRSQGE